MKTQLLSLLMCPVTRSGLTLSNAVYGGDGTIQSGTLTSQANSSISYPIIGGIPRFVPQQGLATKGSVRSFGQQWNYFNFDKFSQHFAEHTIANSFGDYSWFKGKTVVDAGAGSGMQTRWLASNGAGYVIALELSHAVDGIIAENLKGLTNVDVIQCSIDAIPLKDGAITGLVMCNNVIQHTPSVPATVKELWRITGEGAEMAYNCYTRNDSTFAHRARYKFYRGVRAVVSRMPFPLRLAYAHTMSALRFVPRVGPLLEKADMLRRGEVSTSLTGWAHIAQLYRAGVVNTFDYFGAHTYQHHHTFEELKNINAELQPTAHAVNAQTFYATPQPIGTLLRLERKKQQQRKTA